MSQENVEVVRSIYDASNRRDWDAAFRDQHPDVELTTPPGITEGTYRGREECQAYWEDLAMALDAFTIEPEEVFESGDHVVAVVKSRLRPKDSTAEFELRNGHLWALRDGKVLSLQVFPKPEEALEAAGLSE